MWQNFLVCLRPGLDLIGKISSNCMAKHNINLISCLFVPMVNS